MDNTFQVSNLLLKKCYQKDSQRPDYWYNTFSETLIKYYYCICSTSSVSQQHFSISTTTDDSAVEAHQLALYRRFGLHQPNLLTDRLLITLCNDYSCSCRKLLDSFEHWQQASSRIPFLLFFIHLDLILHTFVSQVGFIVLGCAIMFPKQPSFF